VETDNNFPPVSHRCETIPVPVSCNWRKFLAAFGIDNPPNQQLNQQQQQEDEVDDE